MMLWHVRRSLSFIQPFRRMEHLLKIQVSIRLVIRCHCQSEYDLPLQMLNTSAVLWDRKELLHRQCFLSK